ncbi:MAG: hypothetical protein HY320_05570 [Armatimonadetes bacterium]|nr:hypothetical protein [Armatimonadota bacterium]
MPALKPFAEGRTGRGCLLVFGLIWIAFSLFWEGMAWQTGAPVFFLLFGLPFVAIGFGLLTWALLPSIVGMKVARPVVSLSSDAMRGGEAFSLTYQQSFKKAVDVHRIAFQFVFRETATYQRGTDTVTVKYEQIIDSAEHPARRFAAGETFYDQRSLQLPKDGMHTFSALHNKLQWFVKVQVEITGWPDFKEEYEVRVLPERAR